MAHGAMTGVLALGHGSRDAGANEEFESFVERYQARRRDLRVRHGYIELAEPPVSAALQDLARECRHVVVLPVQLFGSGHVKNDIPLALAAARRLAPDVQFAAARPLGVDPALAELAYERLSSVLAPAEDVRAQTAVVVVGRGSSDPDANGDFCKLVRLFGEGRGFGWVLPCFIGITGPTVEETLALVARVRPRRVIVLPYFLFRGRLVDRLREKVEGFAASHPWIAASVAPHLGDHDTLLAVLDRRLTAALEGRETLPCDTCHYRQPIGGIAEHVGGLRALLWSVRHAFTHAQAKPHVHAHPALRKHVLVCGNQDCSEKGSIALIAALRRLIKRSGQQTGIRITRTACLGRCGEGPNVSVYPDGIWYRGVQEEDAGELVREHLLGDRLVARLVDNIMQ
jgi:sirohydrochlorin ferrochelatase/(2Fe-2S) ferredoxin